MAISSPHSALTPNPNSRKIVEFGDALPFVGRVQDSAGLLFEHDPARILMQYLPVSAPLEHRGLAIASGCEA
jgi:hypothetical protein